eukprot:954354-Pyramimonas_sp.AAC.1
MVAAWLRCERPARNLHVKGGGGSHRLRCGSYGLRCGSQGLRCGSYGLRSGSYRLQRGSYGLRCGSYGLRCGSLPSRGLGRRRSAETFAPAETSSPKA